MEGENRGNKTMNISIVYGLNQCVVDVTADADLTEVAFAVESVSSHFLGRGVNRFDCTRTRQENGDCRLHFKALKKSGPMLISKVCSIDLAVRENLFPKNIPADEHFQLEETGFNFEKVADGQHRHRNVIVCRKKENNNTTSIIESFLLKPELPLDVITYGLGDMFTGLFALNCKYVKWQGSLNKVQLYVRHNLSDEKLKSFLLSNSDYEINRKVSTLKD
jgi:hypothetical protein